MSALAPRAGGPFRAPMLPLALRLALRDLRGGLGGFRIFIACIALGVAAIVGVGSATRGLSDSLAREGRRILGGDLAFSLVQRQASPDEASWLAAQGKLSVIAGMRAMARAPSGEVALVEIKAVDDGWPSVGQADLAPAKSSGNTSANSSANSSDTSIADALARRNGLWGVLAEPALLDRLGVAPGDRIRIGDGEFEIRATLVNEPDKLAAGVGLGPRVIMAQEALRTTGLLQPGALTRWTYRVVAPDADDARLAAIEREATARFPEAGWRIATRAKVSPQVGKNIDRFSQFLVLVGLTALVVGGVGVANAVTGFIDRKQPDLATLKAVGASGGYVFVTTLTEAMLAAAIGVVIGVMAGAALPFAIDAAFGAWSPIPLTPALYPREIAVGALYGFLTALVFSLAPLGRAHDIPVSALFRDTIEGWRGALRARYRIASILAAALFLGAVLLFANDRRVALIYIGVTALAYGLLRAIAWIIVALAKRAPRSSLFELRLAIAAIHRPGALTRSVVLSLGLGLTLLVALTLIDVNIRRQIEQGVPGRTPTFFFLDIQNDQLAGFLDFMGKRAPQARVDHTPMMRGRIVRINDIPAAQVRAKENVAWALEGDRGVTYASAPPDGSKVVEGAWWPADYAGPPLVSMEAEVARGLGLKLGDTVTLNVLGRDITARIANLREVNWRSMGINFVFVFTPSTFAGAPHGHLATATWPVQNAGDEPGLLRDLARAFPTVTAVRVREALDAIARVVSQLAVAVRGATAIALLASILVLAGAISAGRRSRIYDTVVLKTLGATRGRLLAATLLEYAVLGLATALFAAAAGAVAAWLILTRVMNAPDFVWAWSAAGQAAALALAVTVALGLIGSWRILGQKPARHLRAH